MICTLDDSKGERIRHIAVQEIDLANLLDSGATLTDESSQVFIEGELVLQADPIPGGDRLVAELRRRGYLVALVADGLAVSVRGRRDGLCGFH